ncbi:MAG: hypothetical protein WC089_03795 [Candidatus Paceibacterota bacterium]
MDFSDNQQLESFLPVYDAIPEKWEDSRPFLVEQLKRISNAVNIREIGWYIDEEVLSGKAFIPGATLQSDLGTSQVFRQVLRKVVNVGPLIAGVNPPIAHGVTFDANLTSINSWVEATNSTTFTAITIVSPELQVVGPNILITSPGAFDRAFFFWEYTQEL